MAALPRTVDVVVVGGGVVGCSIACALAERGVETVLCEARESLGMGSTGASVGGVRHQFAEPCNIALTQRSLQELASFADRYGIDPGLVQNGYLLLAASDETWRTLQINAAVQRAHGVPVDLLGPKEICGLVPGLRVTDITGAAFCGADGFLDPAALVQGFARGARRAGAHIALRTPVTGLLREGERVAGVNTPRGPVGSDVVVNAAGPGLGAVAALVGVDLAVRPVRRHVFITAPTDMLPPDAPLTIDLDAPAYFRPESGGVLFSGAEEEPWDAGGVLDADWARLERVVPRITHRFPPLESARVMRGWAGVRTLTPDRTALLGPVPGVPGFMVAGGFSGHGVMHSPAVGRMIAGLVCGDDGVAADLAPFAPDRFTHSATAEAARAI